MRQETAPVLSALDIFWRFAKDTILLAAIYALLVGTTLALRYFAHLMKDSPLHHGVLVVLEYAIFFSGTTIVALILIYVTVITSRDLAASFRRELTPGP